MHTCSLLVITALSAGYQLADACLVIWISGCGNLVHQQHVGVASPICHLHISSKEVGICLNRDSTSCFCTNPVLFGPSSSLV